MVRVAQNFREYEVNNSLPVAYPVFMVTLDSLFAAFGLALLFSAMDTGVLIALQAGRTFP